MKSRIIITLSAFFVAVLFFNSCVKDTIEADTFGDIEGIVIDGETEEGIATANITTTPATNAIFTEEDGSFKLNNVPTGNYTIQARKNSFRNNSVSVAVREGQIATAFISMNAEDEESDSTVTQDDFEASITSWFNDVDGDSSFVDVNYRVTNTSDSGNISDYEVYFEVETDSGTDFYFDISGESLQTGQSRNGNLRGYIRNTEATEIRISDVWISDNS